MTTFGVYAWPAFSTKADNPYNYIIYDNIVKQGYSVYEFKLTLDCIIKCIFINNYKIFHIHWPSNILFGKNILLIKIRLYIFFIFINLIKIIGKKIVWTVHNLEAHESKFPHLQKALDDFLYKKVDGFISLNQPGLDIIKSKANKNNSQRFVHIFHPHYKEYYINTVNRQFARKILNVSPDKFVFLFLGQIRAYKNVIGLVKAYKEIKNSKVLLLIAGKVHEDIKIELNNVLNSCDNILFVNSFIKNEDLQFYFNCADVVVTPYNKIFNSGSAFLNLSFNKKTLAPNLWALAELKQVVGAQWIKTYQGELSTEDLENCMKEILFENTQSSPKLPELDVFNPIRIATETISFYRSLISVRSLS